MRIKRLAIRNIASIESAELDFENGPLKDAPLFLICGETGAGKTTILDAITLALYGKTPRYSGGNRRRDCLMGGMAFNDSRQLVRRGATEACAVVELAGNDGRAYEARWSVGAVTRGGNKGRLKPDEWTWKDCSKGGIEYTLGREIEPVIARAIGLGFEQFCRTTLLAQGQFTKFLLGNEDEKAEILEKLTDTERFKRLGMAIGGKYAELEDKVKSISDAMRLLSGLGPERPAVEAKIAELQQRLDGLGRRARSLAARHDWLVRAGELSQGERAVRAKLVRAFADLKATEAEIKVQTEAAKAAVEDDRRFFAANGPKAGMYDQAGAILTELGYVRDAREKKSAAEESLAMLKAKLPALEKAKEVAAEALKAASGALDRESSKEELERRKLEAMDLKRLRRDKEAALKRQGDVTALDIRIGSVDKLLGDRKIHEEALAARQEELARRVAELPELEAAFKTAAAKRDAAQAERDKVKSLIDDGIEAIVAGLHVGDECPVCKSRIEHLNSPGLFARLLAEKDAAHAAADKACKKAAESFNAAKVAADGAETKVSDAKRQIEADGKAVREACDEIREQAKAIGVDGTKDGVAAALADCRKAIAGLDEKIAEGEVQEGVIAAIAMALKKLRKDREAAQEALAAREKECLGCESSIKAARLVIDAEDGRARRSLAKASAKIAIPDWQAAWEADSEAWERAFKASAAGYRERKASSPMTEARLDCCTRSAEKLGACMKRALDKVPELSGDMTAGHADEDSPVAVDGLLGQLATIGQQRKAQDDRKPQDLSAEDTVEALSVMCEECRAESERLRNGLAAERQRLAADDKCASDRAAKEIELEAARAAREEWKPIADLFGDQTGKKVQREIQSYVLANVLVKANHYLKQLSGRYELSCEGLMLSVIDADESCAVRPVNTLSGGEQFIVSLALALGLAGMSDSGLGVDMLLIDEGFGTLSGGHLNSAIEALERLNALTGTRKVGVISHVERLRERIKTHVEVTRNGHEPSEVRVVSSSLSAKA